MFGKKSKEHLSECFLREGFTPSKSFDFDWPHFYVDNSSNRWAVWYDKKYDPIFYNFKDILSFEVLENGGSVMKGRTGSAIVGGLTFGVIGAVVGGARSKKIDETCTSLKVEITVNDIDNPNIELNVITYETRKDSQSYKISMDLLHEITSTLTFMQNKASSELPSAQSADPNSEAYQGDAIEQIKRLSELKDQGILTEDEFSAKKQQLLGI